MDLGLNDPDPRIRELAYLLFLDEAIGPEWVERWTRERGKLDALREWRKVARTPDRQGPQRLGAPSSRRILLLLRGRTLTPRYPERGFRAR